ncbi:MAG TPA: S8 family serine peptidase [Anaerolineae bacterium]|nr:S8 family serine peptidase [Anaerolineae bacterium]HQH39065.1 S8 family serine peptidase [Anaerolineae bacterium]
MKIHRRMLESVVLCVMVVTSLLSPWRVNRAVYSATPEAASQPEMAGLPLRLAIGTFDPLGEAAPGSTAQALHLAAYPGDGLGYYLVQFRGPLHAAEVEALKTAGADVFDYIPDFAFIVKMDNATRAVIERQAQVRWIGLYQPAYRMTPDLLSRAARANETAVASTPSNANGKQTGGIALDDDGVLTLVVSVFRGEPVAPIASLIEKMGGQVLDQSQTEWQSKLKITLPTTALAEVAALSGVRWIEPAPQWRLYNDHSDNIMGVREVWDTHGLYGAGQTVAVCDTGLDQGSTAPASLHDDFENGSGVSRVTTIYDRVGDGASDVNSGHGTHVSGSVLGNGDLSGATPASHTYPETAYVGMAPEASLIMQAVENNTTKALSGIPLDLNTLFDQARTGGANLHTNSWGSDVSGQYTTDSEAVDQFMWGYKNFAIFFSAGNSGIDANSDGVVDLYSLGSPATAKNCVTVGASENDRPTFTSTWGGSWPTDYPAAPVNSDRLANNTAGLAAFSSRGPALDGRYKPDIVAPGTFIASTRSSQASATGWGEIDANYMYMGGTSMSTPLTAGAAAIVRQFYTDVKGHSTPSAALLKATLVNGATDIYPGQYGTGSTQEISTTRPTNVAGWGRVDIQNSIFPTAPRQMTFVDQTSGLDTDDSEVYHYQITSSAEPFRVTLAWTDYPGSPTAAGGLVNDLDVTVIGPGGMTYYPNNANRRGASQYLAYDSGFESNYWIGGAGTQAAVRFTPSQYPVTLQTGIFLLAAASYPQTFTWYVYTGNNTSGPTSVLASGSSTIRSEGWHVIDFTSANVTINSGDFFLAIGLPNDQLAWFYDNTAPNSRSWDYDGTAWSKVTTEDYMFHAVVSSAAAATPHDRVNNLEGIDIATPATGIYTVTVNGYNVPHGPQPYALVASGIFTTANTAPTLSGLPDLTLAPGESRDNAIDLWTYASDDLDANNVMTYTLFNSPPAGAGISLDSNRYIDIHPTAGYVGTVPVEVQVTDTGGLTDTDAFTINFLETQYIYLPLVLRGYPPLPELPTTLDVVGDACILQGYPSNNAGTTSDMWAGYDDLLNPDAQIVRSLLRFDLSEIPAYASINSAVLRVFYVGYYDYENYSRTITSYRISSNWSETSVTWNTAPTIGEAYGSVPLIANATQFGWYSIDVTNLVRGWVNGTLPNYGVMLRGPEHSGSDSSWRSFATKEAGSSYAPYLQITYPTMVATEEKPDTVIPVIGHIPSNGTQLFKGLGGVWQQDTLCDVFGCVMP